MAFDFSGKAVLITGASRGVGRACALMFAEQGARVAVHYHTNAQAANLTLEALQGDGHMIVQADVGDPEQVKRMVGEVVLAFGRIDVLVNNAGIYADHPIAETDYETWLAQWRRIVDVNLMGAANAAYWASRHMMETGGGHIVNVSSRGAFRGEPTAPAYGASKAGMNALGQSLAQALAPHNIYVTTVAPGWIATDMATENATGDQAEAIRQQSPLGRIATPEEVAYTVLFLASEGTAFLTGAIVDINGASYLRT